MQCFLLKLDSGNTIISDRWAEYNFISSFNNYSYEWHHQGGGDFGEGLHSTSYIESLWNSLQTKIKNAYHILNNL